MLRSWTIPLGIAYAILTPLVLVADFSDWSRAAFWGTFVAILLPTLILHFWLVDREEKRRAAGLDKGRHRIVR
jgi:hypothetical protein